MSAIIKSADAAIGTSVRALPLPQPAEAPTAPADDPGERLARRIADLEAQITTLTAEAADLRAEAKAALERGKAEGHKTGLAAAEDREDERVAALADGIAASRADLAAALGATERLAAVLAKACLDKLFAETEANAERVCALLRAQMREIERGQLISIVVSENDFSEEGIDRLRAVLNDDAVSIERNPALPSGGCKLQPRLGEIDIGLDTQWAAIGDLLLTMAEGPAPA